MFTIFCLSIFARCCPHNFKQGQNQARPNQESSNQPAKRSALYNVDSLLGAISTYLTPWIVGRKGTSLERDDFFSLWFVVFATTKWKGKILLFFPFNTFLSAFVFSLGQAIREAQTNMPRIQLFLKWSLWLFLKNKNETLVWPDFSFLSFHLSFMFSSFSLSFLLSLFPLPIFATFCHFSIFCFLFSTPFLFINHYKT